MTMDKNIDTCGTAAHTGFTSSGEASRHISTSSLRSSCTAEHDSRHHKPQAGWCSPCAAHLRPTIRRKTTKVNARLPVSSSLDTLSKELPTRSVEERQHLLEQVLRRHALRVGLCVFQQIFDVIVVDRFLELLEGSAARVDIGGDSQIHLVPHPCVREAEEQAHVLREAVVVVGH